jgi:hydroxymethylpyrimidine kinase/phosphomethylpyrimidine kinase
MTAVPRVLSIAGTDPTGGAGIHADLKSIAANGGYGMAAVTALVAQNTRGVRSVHVPPPSFLAEQLDAVSDDVEIDAVKIGMLFDGGIIEVVREWLTRVRPPVVVLDPVMIAASGDPLLAPDAADALRGLVVHTDLVTPNMPELGALLREAPAPEWPGVLDQARRLAEAHGVRVLAKGGHLTGLLAPDALVAPDGSVTEYSAVRVATRNSHGTGCSLSSAVATLRVRLGSWEEALEEAKRWLTASIAAADALHVGQGSGPVSHFAELWERAGTHGQSGYGVGSAGGHTSPQPTSRAMR